MGHPPRPPRALHATLLRPAPEIRKMFHGLATGRDVAELLELDWSQLYYITSSRSYAYTVFTIPKKRLGRLRTIQSPHLSVKILQRKLLSVLYLVYQPHPAAHGFVLGRSIVTNARCHRRKRFVLNVDIEQFFPSITFARVRGLFIKHFGIGEAAATVLARICCNTGDSPDHLPQGAPTSPIISNMICHSLDHQLVTLAKTHGLYYTRYADDLTFSTNRRRFPSGIAEESGGVLLHIGAELERVIDTNGFALNSAKQRMQTPSRRQEVTGLLVNRRVNVRRTYIQQLRGMLHAWKQWGHDAAQATYQSNLETEHVPAEFRRVVSGKLGFLRDVRGVDDRIFRRLYGWARDLDGTLFPELPELSESAPSLRDAVGEFPTVSASDSRETRGTYFRRMIASASGVLWLVDAGMGQITVRDAQRALVEAGTRVAQVRLLSRHGPKDGETDAYRKLVLSLLERGIQVEWRTDPRRLFHDRWIADDDCCVNFGGAFNSMHEPHPPYGQNRIVPRPEHFERWWEESKTY